MGVKARSEANQHKVILDRLFIVLLVPRITVLNRDLRIAVPRLDQFLEFAIEFLGVGDGQHLECVPDVSVAVDEGDFVVVVVLVQPFFQFADGEGRLEDLLDEFAVLRHDWFSLPSCGD
jgi:hypothetical protein